VQFCCCSLYTACTWYPAYYLPHSYFLLPAMHRYAATISPVGGDVTLPPVGVSFAVLFSFATFHAWAADGWWMLRTITAG